MGMVAGHGVGVGIISHGLSAFEVLNFWPRLGEKQIEKRLGKKAVTYILLDINRAKSYALYGFDSGKVSLTLPLMSKEDLIRYKTMLLRPVDIDDIRAIN
ncbi:hypothetical protein HSBAA_45010 [Vreelandella sulfidaeris]|uniref:Uncharacterized protein n=1 Tax=Vreelandella sulfidaeris TaxID=115553 RepID=A0A455UAY8_9GAMM|nr:hypothetical protein HSBAA_45010 [Halomonas sulfidaeris]